ncbi:phage integrase family protein [Clostridioides difficile CD160]|nr:phage integrase family protein [Clostridioides difficile CD160]
MGTKRPANPIKDKNMALNIQEYLKEKSIRNYVLFVLGIGTGYRAGDLVKLQVRDVRKAIDEGYFLIMESKKEKTKNIRKKNKKPRKAPIVPNLERVLKNYIKNKKDYEYMFPSRQKSVTPHIGVERVTEILKEAGRYFGLKHITAHSMRKTYAHTIYEESGFDIIRVKEMLGHSSIEETKAYLGLNEEQYQEYSMFLNDLIG